ncbi:uncharacterized protein SPAPADRAFT_157650 [Spathaspora passalidarum NRRL Y-27907]|uniref:tRNA(Ile)-lysidine synthetase n=1 Tax=Spathaspora passalidarum (strain NRRL Y-27907 / 11-Y1) TaxID=619300 RepID=G3AUE1_SPAPN|nr:uncharacterized protein SPAPADRAFT_157650 [Spathaspora passalidarum NRRL Y-27907]EGW30517.1 hypothetical protein SPAPADRAFT_157650 [Spathaspora passalidarum NRRL Y-27907]
MNRISLDAFSNVLRKYFNTADVLPRRVAIALSGGADSMLLTYLLTQYKHLHSPHTEIYAITIDHKYRPESTDETKHIRDIVKQWDVHHVVKTLSYDQEVSSIGNFEEVARHKRYLKFENVCKSKQISALFMGHHLDDQLETFIQRLQGNSSLYGLAGTRKITRLPRNDLSPIDNHHSVFVYRPFWQFEKRDIVDTCQFNGVRYFNDPTNQDIDLTRRNYLRHLIGDVIPAKITKHSQYSCISKQALRDSHEQVYNLAESFEEKANNIKNMIEKNGWIRTNDAMSSLNVKIPRRLFAKPNEIVLGKYFYQILYPYSTLKHYHWAYAKLERQLVPKIQRFLDTDDTTFKTTMMNLTFDINIIEEDILDIAIKRQPIVTGDDVSLSVDVTDKWSEYVLFDRRFWVRFCSAENMQVKVIPYMHKKCKPRLAQDLLKSKQVNSKLNTLPAVMYHHEIIAFPSIGLVSEKYDSFRMECSLKENKYGRLEQEL